MLTLIQYYFSYVYNRKQLSPFAFLFSLYMICYYNIKKYLFFLILIYNFVIKYVIMNLNILITQNYFYSTLLVIFNELIYISCSKSANYTTGDVLWSSFLNNKEIYKLYIL